MHSPTIIPLAISPLCDKFLQLPTLLSDDQKLKDALGAIITATDTLKSEIDDAKLKQAGNMCSSAHVHKVLDQTRKLVEAACNIPYPSDMGIDQAERDRRGKRVGKEKERCHYQLNTLFPS